MRMKDDAGRRLEKVPAYMLGKVEALFSRVFQRGANPFHYLGGLTIFFFWVALVTGIYLFIFYRTSIDGAWESVEYLSREQWYLGGIMRSLHRYASDGAVLCMFLHLGRELVRGRLFGPRWFSWFTGMPLLWIVTVFGISGYWMVWDQLAQYVAISTARMLDILPVFTEPMSNAFISDEAVSNRLFTLIAFIHLIGLPIVLVLGIWFHLLRIKMPRINPPRKLMMGSMLAMLALSVVYPVHSHAPADLDAVPGALNMDWFYLAAFPLMSLTSETLVWGVATGITLFLSMLPWLLPSRREPVAQVHLEDCSGCTYCAEDCPYGAIDMVPRTDGRNFEWQAQVNADLCVSCGICTGSCPSSSPFRAREPLTTGIELPGFTMNHLRESLPDAPSGQDPAVVVFGCDHSVNMGSLDNRNGMRAVSLPCTGTLPPSMIDYALRKAGYQGVVITGCDSCDCHHRLGDTWTEERIARERPPSLRKSVPRERILTTWLKFTESALLLSQIKDFRQELGHPEEHGEADHD